MQLTTPSITPAQVLAAIGAVVGLLVANGLVTNRTEKLIDGLAAIVVPVAVVLADAHIRHGRAKALAAGAQAAKPPTTGP